ncbi:AMP-binding protein [Pirellulaceae bacterium SH467]
MAPGAFELGTDVMPCGGQQLSALSYLGRHARFRPDSVAWIERSEDLRRPPQKIVWGQLAGLVGGFAHELLRLGIRPLDRVVIWGFNSLDWILTDWACSVLGATSVPLDPRLSDQTAREIINRVSTRATFLGPLHRERVAGLPLPEWRSMPIGVDTSWLDSRLRNESIWNASQPATILFTSGTSSVPKGVMLSHGNLLSNALAKLKAMPQFPTDHRVNLLPFAHAYARTCELTTWLISGSSMEVACGLEDFFCRLPLAQPTLINAVPSVYEALIARLPSPIESNLRVALGGRIRQLASGGAPLPNVLRSNYQDAGMPIYQGYGLTETSPVVCSNIHPDSGAPTCLDGVGPPVAGTEVMLDSDSNLWVRGPNVMMGYWNEDKETSLRWQQFDAPHEGSWFRTGDLARRITGTDSLEILGRCDDTIVLANGYKLHPLGLEVQLSSIPLLEDSVVIPGPHGTWRICIPGNEAFLGAEQLSELEKQVLSRCSQEFRKSFSQFVICPEPWTIQSGLLNFKGGKRRNVFAERFGR